MVRRIRFAVLTMTLCLTLTACGGTDKTMQAALDLRSALLEAGGCCFSAEITADFGETVFTFAADCEYTADAKTRVAITALETIAGITATVADDGASVEYDDLLLDFGTLAGGHAAPVAAPSILALCWAGEYIDSTGQEGENILVTYLRGYDSGELTVLTRLSAETGLPVAGEVIWDGQTVLSVTITDFSYLTE